MFDNFERLVRLMAQYRTDVMLSIILLIAAGAGWTAWENRQNIVDGFGGGETPHVISPEQFKRLVDADQSVYVSLNRLMTRTGAARIVVRRFHNGRVDFGGVPFENVEDVYEVLRPDLEEGGVRYVSLPMAAFANTLDTMFTDPRNPTCLVNDNHETLDRTLTRFHAEYNFTNSMYCPIISLNGAPIGLLTVNFNDRYTPKLTEEQILAMTTQTATKVTGYLDTKLRIESE